MDSIPIWMVWLSGPAPVPSDLDGAGDFRFGSSAAGAFPAVRNVCICGDAVRIAQKRGCVRPHGRCSVFIFLLIALLTGRLKCDYGVVDCIGTVSGISGRCGQAGQLTRNAKTGIEKPARKGSRRGNFYFLINAAKTNTGSTKITMRTTIITNPALPPMR